MVATIRDYDAFYMSGPLNSRAVPSMSQWERASDDDDARFMQSSNVDSEGETSHAFLSSAPARRQVLVLPGEGVQSLRVLIDPRLCGDISVPPRRFNTNRPFPQAPLSSWLARVARPCTFLFERATAVLGLCWCSTLLPSPSPASADLQGDAPRNTARYTPV